MTNTPNFSLWITDMTPKLALPPTFVSCGDRTSTNFSSYLANLARPCPKFCLQTWCEVQVPQPPYSLFGSTRLGGGWYVSRAKLRVYGICYLEYIIAWTSKNLSQKLSYNRTEPFNQNFSSELRVLSQKNACVLESSKKKGINEPNFHATYLRW